MTFSKRPWRSYGVLVGDYMRSHGTITRTACALRIHDPRERVLFCINHSIDTISFGWFIVMQTSIGERNAFESALIALAAPYNRCTNPLRKLTLLVIAVDAR